MRVSGGKGRGRKLRVPAGARVRPTSDKVKQALFNILGDRVQGAAFLDLYAGAGGIGIEALSRGAGRVIFVDTSRDSADCIRQNLDNMGIGEGAQVIQADVQAFLNKHGETYDIVFLDPPYAMDLGPLLEQIGAARVVKVDSLVIAEHFKKQPSPEQAGRLVLDREKHYGDTVLAFYKLA